MKWQRVQRASKKLSNPSKYLIHVVLDFAASETESQNIFISARDSITVYDYDIQYFECSALFSSVLHNPRAFLADSALTATEY